MTMYSRHNRGPLHTSPQSSCHRICKICIRSSKLKSQSEWDRRAAYGVPPLAEGLLALDRGQGLRALVCFRSAMPDRLIKPQSCPMCTQAALDRLGGIKMSI